MNFRTRTTGIFHLSILCLCGALLSISCRNPGVSPDSGEFGCYGEVGLIALQARNLGLNVPLLGGDGWDSPKLLEIGGEALDGSYYSNHYTMDNPGPAVQAFVSAYKARYGRAPDAPAALGFDAANVVFDAIRRADSTEGAKLRDAIAATKDYPGVTGAITLDRDRNAVKPAVVLRIQNRKAEFVETVSP